MEENLDQTPGGLHQNRPFQSVGGIGSPARQPGQDNGFDYQAHQQPNLEDHVFEGGMGDALGDYGDENDLMAMEEELNGDENEDGAGQDTLEITLSINFDEEDSNSLNLNLLQLFQADPGVKCYQQKVSKTLPLIDKASLDEHPKPL